MKKVITVVLLMSLVMAFFSFGVNASTTEMASYVSEVHNLATLATGVTCHQRATMFGPVIGTEIVNVSGSPGIKVYDAYVPVLIELRFSNTTDSNYVLNTNVNCSLYYDYADNFPNGYGISKGIRQITNYTDDLYLSYYYTNAKEIRVNASSSFSYNGFIVIPAHTNLLCIAEVRMNAYYMYSSSGYEARVPTLNSIGIGSPTASTTNYNPIGVASGSGSMTSSQVVELLDYLDNISTNSDDIFTILGDIKDRLSWVGSFPTVSYTTMSTNTFTGTLNSNVDYQITRSYTGSYPVLDMTDFEPPDDIYSDILYKHTYVYLIRLTNNNNYALNASGPIRLSNIQNVSNIRNISISGFYTQSFTNPYLYITASVASIYFYQDRDVNALYVGDNRIVIYVDVYSNQSTAPTLLDPTITMSGNFSQYTDEISQDSDAIVNQSDNIHTQEQMFFEQNAQAIQATGLGNYQFSTNQAAGVQAVTSDFNSVFNALGTWRNVYVFSMTLGLALTIIRHSPNAISRKIRNKNSE